MVSLLLDAQSTKQAAVDDCADTQRDRENGELSQDSHSLEDMFTYQPTGQVCPHCQRPITDQVNSVTVNGGEQVETRTGPRCWTAGCPGNRR